MMSSIITHSGLAQALLAYQHLTAVQLKKAAEQAKQQQQSLIDYLIDQQYVSAAVIAKACAKFYGLDYINLHEYQEDCPKELINYDLIKMHLVLPIVKQKEHLLVAIADPEDFLQLEKMTFQTGLKAVAVMVDYDLLKNKINNILSQRQYAKTQHIQLEDAASSNDSAPIVNLVNQVITDAINKQASDIHFEPYGQYYRIRMRIDGVLYDITKPPLRLASAITSRLKVMAELDISEKRLPQDGRFTYVDLKGMKRDCRLNTCPTLFGEKCVLRLLNPLQNCLSIEALGMQKSAQQCFLDAIYQPQGLILVTGPTGSGKTVSLYTALSLLNQSSHNISTIEDPVEIQLPGINQVNVNHKIGLNFAKALRAFLRQDPDIIMVGEIRDTETAEMAIRAAQTGHLVLSTLHTNSAAETLTRLSNMGVANFNLASAMTVILAQRLVRKLCPHCKQIENLPKKTLEQAGMDIKQIETATLFKANGCMQCTQGYQGRMGVFEVMPIEKNIRELILQGKPTLEIEKQAKQLGMKTLWQSVLEQVCRGMLSLEEAYRVVQNAT